MEAVLLLITSILTLALAIIVFNTLLRKFLLWAFAPLLKKAERRRIEKLMDDHDQHKEAA